MAKKRRLNSTLKRINAIRRAVSAIKAARRKY